MWRKPFSTPYVIGAIVALSGCMAEADPDVSGPDVELPAETAEPVVVDHALLFEQAERKLDVGQDLAGAASALRAITTDKTAPLDVRCRAGLALSRAEERLGNKDAAVRAVEAVLAAHEGDHNWGGSKVAEARLRALLTGSEKAPPTLERPSEPTSEFAKLLMPYFPTKKGERTEVMLTSFGRDEEASARLGTFAIAATMRAHARDVCPLCKDDINVGTSSSGFGSWTSIPSAVSRMQKSVVVLYTHLGDPIPAWFDRYLPAPMADVKAHLERGEGLISVKIREGAPPVILIAAPREAQLPVVEEALSKMTSLPAAPVVVPVKPNLAPQEIQSIVRRHFRDFRACYEDLLRTDPQAEGRVEASFDIEGDGRVSDLAIQGSGAMEQRSAVTCMTTAFQAMQFPATGTKTTVKYPVQFTPGD